MMDFAPDLQAIYSKYEPEIGRLKQMLWNMHSVSNVRYVYSYLRSLLTSRLLVEFIMLSEPLTTLIVYREWHVCHQNNDGRSHSCMRIWFREQLRPIHNEIMSLRHERFAHHGAHEITKVDIQSTHDCLVVMPELNHAPKEWGLCFSGYDELMYEESKKQLEHLSRISGIKWTMPHGPSPSWLSDQSTSTQP
jgi:hypothetical protein